MENSTFNIKFWKKNWIVQNFRSLCLKCYFTSYKALSIPVRESISYLFSSFPMLSTLDKLYHFILIIAPRGVGIITLILWRRKRSVTEVKWFAKVVSAKLGLEPGSDTFPLYCLEWRRKKCVQRKCKRVWPSGRIVLPSSNTKSAGPRYGKH